MIAEADEYVRDGDILVRKGICKILSERDLWGDRAVVGGPALTGYSVSMKDQTSLKNAYVKLGSVPLGWFNSTPKQGIYVEEVQLPNPFEWKLRWPEFEKLVDCDLSKRIEEEFGIQIEQYLGFDNSSLSYSCAF